MANRRAFDFLLLLGCVIERIAQKNVRVPTVARVSRDDRVERFGESNFLHNKRRSVKSGAYDKRRRKRRQAVATAPRRSITRLTALQARRDKPRSDRAGAVPVRARAQP